MYSVHTLTKSLSKVRWFCSTYVVICRLTCTTIKLSMCKVEEREREKKVVFSRAILCVFFSSTISFIQTGWESDIKSLNHVWFPSKPTKQKILSIFWNELQILPTRKTKANVCFFHLNLLMSMSYLLQLHSTLWSPLLSHMMHLYNLK